MRRHLSSCALAPPAAAALAPAPAQQKPLPVIDVPLHASAADSQGPPPLGLCPGAPRFPTRDPQSSWPDIFLAHLKKPPCDKPVWSPMTDDALREQTIAVLKRRNVIGVLSGAPSRVARWRQDAPDLIIPAVSLEIPSALSPAGLRELHAKGQVAVLGEVSSQYQGVTADNPAFEPYLAIAEQLDLPVGIHIGTGPPGAPYLGYDRYRARLHSALTLEEPLLKHP